MCWYSFLLHLIPLGIAGLFVPGPPLVTRGFHWPVVLSNGSYCPDTAEGADGRIREVPFMFEEIVLTVGTGAEAIAYKTAVLSGDAQKAVEGDHRVCCFCPNAVRSETISLLTERNIRSLLTTVPILLANTDKPSVISGLIGSNGRPHVATCVNTIMIGAIGAPSRLQYSIYTSAVVIPPLAAGVVPAFDRATHNSVIPTLNLRDSCLDDPSIFLTVSCLEIANITAPACDSSLQFSIRMDVVQLKVLGNPAPIDARFTIVCPNHMQFGQKGRHFTPMRQPMGKRRQLEYIYSAVEFSLVPNNSASFAGPFSWARVALLVVGGSWAWGLEICQQLRGRVARSRPGDPDAADAQPDRRTGNSSTSKMSQQQHLWDELDRRVRARQARPKSIAQLMEWLQEEWRRIPVDVLQTLVESMPDRVAAVIAARGLRSIALGGVKKGGGGNYEFAAYSITFHKVKLRRSFKFKSTALPRHASGREAACIQSEATGKAKLCKHGDVWTSRRLCSPGGGSKRGQTAARRRMRTQDREAKSVPSATVLMTWYGEDPPALSTKQEWHRKFMGTGSVLHQKGAGWPSTITEDIDRVRAAYVRSPGKSVRTAARQLQLPRSTVHKVLHKQLRLYAYKLQLVQAPQLDHARNLLATCCNMFLKRDIVYNQPGNNLDELKQRIVATIETVDE
ncbi:hypothetical protein PR048_033338 [Dryococelus australis]|uniref:Uncharacterized protein n=1 Tax=Dryococelus australis TaxID=614101 RepID=A0ABQ9G469_9NEOP|nr:hypothetical protein PR048_033338 [Dryococelus australis]